MSHVVMMHRQRTEPQGSGPRLGPAEVVKVSPNEVEVRLKNGALVRATMALGYAYEAREKDVLLVIGDEDGHYVIGVLKGAGRTALELPGDVDVRAVNGVLRLSGDQGVEVSGPEVTVNAGKLKVLAEAAVERFTSLYQRVTDLWSQHAGERHTTIDGASHEQAKSATILTEEKMTINGKAIYLG